MELTIRQSYFAMFYLLNEFNWTVKDECLEDLLSNFSPFTFIDSMSADPAAWQDWGNCIKKISAGEFLTSEEALRATWAFVNFHIEEFGFELQWVIDRLNTMSVDSEEWKKCVDRALVGGDDSQYMLK